MFDQIGKDLIAAIKSRDQGKIRALQGIKAQLLLLRTEKGKPELITGEDELRVLQKMAKQRRDSMEIFQKENRNDLLQKEQEELTVIEQYLPAQMSDEELGTILRGIIERVGAKSPADIGKVMGAATKELAGKADGKRISETAKKLLS